MQIIVLLGLESLTELFGGTCGFRIYGQWFINKNCHNSRTRHYIDMNLVPVTRPEKRNKATSKNRQWRHVGKL